jgi:hypothetical protein
VALVAGGKHLIPFLLPVLLCQSCDLSTPDNLQTARCIALWRKNIEHLEDGGFSSFKKTNFNSYLKNMSDLPLIVPGSRTSVNRILWNLGLQPFLGEKDHVRLSAGLMADSK